MCVSCSLICLLACVRGVITIRNCRFLKFGSRSSEPLIHPQSFGPSRSSSGPMSCPSQIRWDFSSLFSSVSSHNLEAVKFRKPLSLKLSRQTLLGNLCPRTNTLLSLCLGLLCRRALESSISSSLSSLLLLVTSCHQVLPVCVECLSVNAFSPAHQRRVSLR